MSTLKIVPRTSSRRPLDRGGSVKNLAGCCFNVLAGPCRRWAAGTAPRSLRDRPTFVQTTKACIISRLASDIACPHQDFRMTGLYSAQKPFSDRVMPRFVQRSFGRIAKHDGAWMSWSIRCHCSSAPSAWPVIPISGFGFTHPVSGPSATPN